MKFRYQAKTKEGEDQVGFVEAGSQEAAVSILTTHDLFVLKIEAAESEGFMDRLGSYFGGVKSKDMVIFSRQLATLLEARLSLNKALGILHEQTQSPALKEAIAQIAQDVDSGLSFSQALERQGAIFSGFFIAMIRSAEVTGNLDKVTSFLADYTEREAVIASKAKSAMMYPGVIIGLFVVIAGVMVTFIFPQLQPIFENSGVELPLYTRILLNSGVFLGTWWPVVLVALFVAVGGLLEYLKTPEGKAITDEIKIRAPLFKKIFVPLTVTRFANASTMLVKGGVPVAQAMEIVAETLDNVLYRDVMHEISEDIREGVTLSDAIAKHPAYFPVLVSQMIAVGESTGQLDSMLVRVSNFYNREADDIINNLVDLMQPAILIVIAVMIGFLFASILVPLYKFTSQVGG